MMNENELGRFLQVQGDSIAGSLDVVPSGTFLKLDSTPGDESPG